jgi:hypothetical protein
MNDLRTLLWPTADSDGSDGHDARSSSNSASLQALVGASQRESTAPISSATLRELVGESAAVSSSPIRDLSLLVGSSVERPSETSSAPALAALVGAPEAAAPAAPPLDLSVLVGKPAQQKFDSDGWQAPELAQVGARPIFGGRRRAGAVNYLSIAAATIAVVALVATTSFAVIQRATANPADDAMISLREREAELTNETKVLQTAADLYEGSVEEAVSLAETSAPVLAGLTGRVDGAPLGAAEAARVALANVASSAVEVSVPDYERGQIDEKDLASVGKAIDGVRLAREALPALIADARDARSAVVSALAAYRAELSSLGTAIESEAAKIVSANDSAASSFRTAVTDAAARIVTSQRAGGDGLPDMPAYVTAVDALRAENSRVVAIEEAEREAAPTRPSNPGGGTDGDSGGSSDPGTPSDPQPSPPAPSPDPEPSPEPSPPAPSPDPEPSPEPSQPSNPDPEPTAPAEGGDA